MISKTHQITAFTFSDTISVWYQDEKYLWKYNTKHKNFGPDCKTRVFASNSSFGSKVKISLFAPNIFWAFYQFSGSLSLTFEYRTCANKWRSQLEAAPLRIHAKSDFLCYFYVTVWEFKKWFLNTSCAIYWRGYGTSKLLQCCLLSNVQKDLAWGFQNSYYTLS